MCSCCCDSGRSSGSMVSARNARKASANRGSRSIHTMSHSSSRGIRERLRSSSTHSCSSSCCICCCCRFWHGRRLGSNTREPPPLRKNILRGYSKARWQLCLPGHRRHPLQLQTPVSCVCRRAGRTLGRFRNLLFKVSGSPEPVSCTHLALQPRCPVRMLLRTHHGQCRGAAPYLLWRRCSRMCSIGIRC